MPKEKWNKVFSDIFGECNIQWKQDLVSQIDFGSDALVTTKKGRKYSIDVKTRHQDFLGYKTWLLEIVHHRYTDETKRKKTDTVPGWLYRSTSDLIIIGTVDDIDEPTDINEYVCFSLIPFKNEDFKGSINFLCNGWAATEFDNGTFQLTLNKKAPLGFLQDYSNFPCKYWRKNE